MIVYLLTRDDRVHDYLANGIKRSTGRTYVYPSWEEIKTCLQSMSRVLPEEDFKSVRVLVLDLDQDMMLPGLMPHSQLPEGLSREDLERLLGVSLELETDIDPARIEGVRDAFGNRVSDRYQHSGSRPANLRRFMRYLKPYWPLVAGATLAGILKFLIPLSFPWMVRVVLDDILPAARQPGSDTAADLLAMALLLIGLNVLWVFVTYARGMLTATAGHSMIRDLRVDLFGHLQRLSHHFFALNQTGAIVARVVGDIAQAQSFVGSALTNVWMDTILMIVLLVILIPMHQGLSLVGLALLPVFLVSVTYLGNKIRLSSVEVQQRVEVLSGGLQEKVAGIGIVKGFTREGSELQSFRAQSDKLYSKVLRSVRYATWNEMVVGFIVMTSPVLVVWYGATLILSGELTVGQLTQFLLYLAMFYAPLQRLADLGRLLAAALASIDRVFEYFDTMPQVRERPHPLRLTQVGGDIAFQNVCFGYEPGKSVLEGITLSISAGETVAFVGPSGSGKSTLANLIPRFYDPSAGAITLDGVDLRDLVIEDLRRQIGIVNQETILFSGTIRENLMLANPGATPAQITQALAAANALPFVDELPEGLWTEVGERGVRLSGGQKQRLALARAFLKDPRILILDEATSALDSRSEHLIQEALERLLEDRTSIVIAHRLSTILNADRIATLDHGQLVELGSHHKLLEQGGLYAQLYEEQFSGS